MNNREYLNNLAATDPQALQAWFDAPRGGLDAPRADCDQVDGNHSKADSDDSNVTQKEPVSLRDCFGILSDSPKCSEMLRNEHDRREQLERDINYWLNSWTGASVPVSEIKQAVGQWLDRQSAIIRAECDKPNWEYCETCDYERANERQARKIENVCAINAELQEQVDNLSNERNRLHRRNSELRTQYDNLRMQVDNLAAECDEKAGLLETAFRRCKELQAQVDAMKSESSEFADGQDYWHDKCYELRDAINVLQKKQPYSYNPYKPLNTLNTIGRYIDELQDKVDNLAHDLAESERLREEMREELSIAYDHAHDLLARRDRGLA